MKVFSHRSRRVTYLPMNIRSLIIKIFDKGTISRPNTLPTVHNLQEEYHGPRGNDILKAKRQKPTFINEQVVWSHPQEECGRNMEGVDLHVHLNKTLFRK